MYLPVLLSLLLFVGDGLAERVSEKECTRYKNIAQKQPNGSCKNENRPHIVQIVYKHGLEACSGVLVSEKSVLVACSCALHLTKLVPLKVHFRDNKEVAVKSTTCHSDFKKNQFYHDVAVIELATPVTLSADLVPACLASNTTENLRDVLVLTGYTSDANMNNRVFHDSSKNRVLTEAECNKDENLKSDRTTFPRGVDAAQLCALSSDDDRHNVFRDPGSSLQSFSAQTCMHTAVGVLNIDALYPKDRFGLYTRVSYHLDWIEGLVWGTK